ncbi:MAG: winged helix DNA-binding protein [Rhodospirillaceae bacterium]|nr:winged helix DNA-binding protein [Rhodospirillaceae bacterium]
MTDKPDRYMSSTSYAATLTRMEVAMVRTIMGFGRWTAACQKSVCGAALGPEDVWLLHAIRMRGGPQNLSELLLFLNRNDVSTIQYSLKKIEQWGLIERAAGSTRREAGYRLTKKGMEATRDYAELREEMLVRPVGGSVKRETLEETAASLETMTGLYDQATQRVLNRTIMGL